MNLSWGAGDFDLIWDIKKDQIIKYASKEDAEIVHQTFGGKNYYISCSGMSGAGYIPDNLFIVKLSTYRVDTHYPTGNVEMEDNLPGYKILVPIDYGKGIIRNDYPLIIHTDGKKYFMGHESIGWTIRCGIERASETSEKIFKTEYIKAPGKSKQETYFYYSITDGSSIKKNIGRVITSLYLHEKMRFEYSSEESEQTPNFYKRLGMSIIGGVYYKIVNQICIGAYSKEEIGTLEGLQKVSPRNTAVLTDNLYIQSNGSEYEAVGIFDNGFGEVEDYEVKISLSQFIATGWGNWKDIELSLREGVERKFKIKSPDVEVLKGIGMEELREIEDSYSAYTAEYEKEKKQKEKEYYERYFDLKVSFKDSLDSGNCEPGTRDFKSRLFYGRDSVTVKELYPYINVYGVKRVIDYKIKINNLEK